MQVFVAASDPVPWVDVQSVLVFAAMCTSDTVCTAFFALDSDDYPFPLLLSCKCQGLPEYTTSPYALDNLKESLIESCPCLLESLMDRTQQQHFKELQPVTKETCKQYKRPKLEHKAVCSIRVVDWDWIALLTSRNLMAVFQ